MYNRRTVRVTYFRDTELLMVSVNQGEEVISGVIGTNDEGLAERKAAAVASDLGLEVSRVDVGRVR
jgi:hypothetical protein